MPSSQNELRHSGANNRRRTMQARLNPYKAAPEMMNALGALENAVQASGLEQSLIDLIKTRASQINGCAYCIHMHTTEARRRGESEERLYLLDAWRESPLYSDRERAALAWTEAVTLISQTHAPDDVYEVARAAFSEAELVKLTTAIATINAWNRIAISFRSIHPVKVAHKSDAAA
jgi:AhpD family alkylhydroperoxidase